MIGIPTFTKKEKFNSKKVHIETRGIEKALVMKGAPKVIKIIEDSVYDTKPVN